MRFHAPTITNPRALLSICQTDVASASIPRRSQILFARKGVKNEENQLLLLTYVIASAHAPRFSRICLFSSSALLDIVPNIVTVLREPPPPANEYKRRWLWGEVLGCTTTMDQVPYWIIQTKIRGNLRARRLVLSNTILEHVGTYVYACKHIYLCAMYMLISDVYEGLPYATVRLLQLQLHYLLYPNKVNM